MTWQNFSSQTDPVKPEAQPHPKGRQRALFIGAVLVLLAVLCITLLGIAWNAGHRLLAQTTSTPAYHTVLPSPAGTDVQSTPDFTATPPVSVQTAVQTATGVPVIYLVWSQKTQAIPVYEQPTTDSKVVASLPNGSRIGVQEQAAVGSQTWFYSAGARGWLPASTAFRQQAEQIRYVTHSANVREQPNGRILLALRTGSPVYLVGPVRRDETGQSWRQVRLLDDQQGWVAEWLLGEQP